MDFSAMYIDYVYIARVGGVEQGWGVKNKLFWR